MAAGKAIGCFGLTEPTAGSDPSAMTTFARRDGHDWVLNGTKRWIGLANVAQVAVIWAQTDTGVRGFVVPTATPGFTATPIEPKLSMRASVQCDISLENVRLPDEAVLPDVSGLQGPFSCLNEARYGIAWGTMGAARDAFEDALAYSRDRLQFGRPLAGYQLTQQKLVNMALEINKGFLLALHLGRLKDAGKLQPHQISVGKLNNCREAIDICREARTILGRQRDYPRILAAAPRQQPRISAHLRGHRRSPHPHPWPEADGCGSLPVSAGDNDALATSGIALFLGW